MKWVETTEFEEWELPCVNEKCRYNDHMFEQNCAAMIRDAGAPYLPYCKKYIAEGTNCAGASEMNTKFEELTRKNQLVSAVIKSGGTAEDCAVALVEMNDRLLKHLMQLSSISVSDWVAEEIKTTWRAARDAGGEMAAFRIIERMVDRLGYGRTENNPSLVPNARCECRDPRAVWKGQSVVTKQ